MINVGKLFCGAASGSDDLRDGEGGEKPSVPPAAKRRPPRPRRLSGLAAMTKGCLAGTAVCFIPHRR